MQIIHLNDMIKYKSILIIIPALYLLITSCEKEVFTGVTEVTKIESEKLFVSSNPPGFRIYVDDKYMGVVTPDTIKWLKSGTHKVTLKNDLYLHDTIFTVNLAEKIVNKVEINLLTNQNFYARIYCMSLPTGATIFMNNVNTGFTTSRQFNGLIPGNYNIKFKKSMCRDDSVAIFVKGGQYLEVFKMLEDTTRSVNYRTHNSKIISNSLTKIIIDKNNNKWIGSVNKGLVKFDGKNWTIYDNGFLGDARITDLLIDKRDRLWIAYSTGLVMLEGNSWSTLTGNLPSNVVNALEQDNDGNIWIGTYNGLVKYDGVNYQIFNKSNSPLTDNNIQALTLLKNGSIAIGTARGGIFIRSNSNWLHHNIAEDLAEDKIANNVIDLIEYNNVLLAYVLGDTFEGTRSSYIRYINGAWEKYSLPLQFAVEPVSFYIDSANNLWIAGKTGLVKLNTANQAKLFNTQDYSFYSNNYHCTSTVLDKSGDIYTTILDGGLVKIKKGYY
ncbi:MAG: PEGA domain-containing protein [Ignavibacteria bacterium]|nr:PEGA domain-containing protein [Ignavibacteria bacterium]